MLPYSALQSNQIYHNAISDLLKSSTELPESKTKSSAEIEALIRLMSNMNETLEPVSVAPGISFALEQLLINERKTDADVVAQNLTVLSNLLILVRFEL